MDILKLFQYEDKLQFTDIQTALNIRSNKLAYHLKKLTKKGILSKDKDFYFLSETTECLIPYMAEKKSTLPAILIHIGDRNNSYLIKRKKRPYKDMWGMPGGRILANESIKEATKRIMKQKYNIDASLTNTHSVSLEHLIKNKKSVHSFILIFVSARTKDKIDLKELEKIKKNMIKSDYLLIKNDLNKDITIKNIISKTN